MLWPPFIMMSCCCYFRALVDWEAAAMLFLEDWNLALLESLIELVYCLAAELCWSSTLWGILWSCWFGFTSKLSSSAKITGYFLLILVAAA